MVFVAALLPTRDARAHAMRVATLEMVESSQGNALAILRLPTPTRDVWPTIDGCTLTPLDPSARFVHRAKVHCPNSLAGHEIVAVGLGPTVSELVVRVQLVDGAVASQVLMPAHPRWSIPASPTVRSIAPRYARLGVFHVLTGWDHLAFVLGLILISRRALVATITAFTVAHSLTLSLTALDLLHASAGAAEACIALSLVVVALDARDGEVGHPVPLAFAFGLVHGLGFAGALGETGLPRVHLGVALLSFNVGVEVAQLGFVALVLATLSAALRVDLLARRAAVARAGAVWAIGAAGAAAFLLRANELWGAS